VLTSTEFAEIFESNPAKVKRHVRDFLPPDGTVGQQKGYARILSLDDAFTLFLASEIIGVYKFSIPDTRMILQDLKPWMMSNGIVPSKKCLKNFKTKSSVEDWEIQIFRMRPGIFYYEAHGLIDLNEVEKIPGLSTPVYINKFTIDVIGAPRDKITWTGECPPARFDYKTGIPITGLWAIFIKKMVRTKLL